jgi:hypothetical protein
MEETLEGGRGPPRAVAPLERERERERERNMKICKNVLKVIKCIKYFIFFGNKRLIIETVLGVNS